jgi:phosphoglycerate dehydrogenase-like enzyme
MAQAGIRPGAVAGFVGLGTMGRPMAIRLAEAGYQVQGDDVSEQTTRDWAERARGASPAPDLGAVVAGTAAVILMLPDSAPGAQRPNHSDVTWVQLFWSEGQAASPRLSW